MSRNQNHRRLPFVVAAALASFTVGLAPASAHIHPTPVDRATPAVVYIEARAQVDVALIEHKQVGDTFGVHIGIHASTWDPVLATGSGFVVDPNGDVVTSAALTSPDLNRAKVYAVNQAFHQRYGAAAPLPSDPFTQQHIGGSGGRNDQRLQACYGPPDVANEAGGCVVHITPDLVVYPYVTSQARYGTLHAQVEATSNGVAVLRVPGANSMPTVPLAQTVAGAEALGVIGFTGIPGSAHPVLEVNQHLAQKGGKVLKSTGLDAGDVKDAARLKQLLSQGFAGGPVLAEQGQVIGLIPGPPQPGQAAPSLIEVGTILPVLQKAGVTPHSGLVDTSYETAMHLFKNAGYAGSIPDFQRALELYPGHFMASTNLAKAQQQVAAGHGVPASAALSGTSQTTPVATSHGWWWPWGALGLAVIVLGAAVAGALLLMRRREAGAGTGAAPPRHGGAAPPKPGASVARGASGPGPSGNGPVRSPMTAQAGPMRSPDRVAAASAPASTTGGTSTTGRASTTGGRAGAAAPDPGAPSHPPVQGGVTPAAAPAARGRVAGDPAPAERRFCTDCGRGLAPKHKFCGWCGEPVG